MRGLIVEVFAALVSQDYWLACNLQMPKDTTGNFSEALVSMRKDGTYRKLTDPRRPAAN